jgi:2-polyprenyl-3-methyl-5-hydroxy-6-metoxy-1,4-benzoquinol methylase
MNSTVASPAPIVTDDDIFVTRTECPACEGTAADKIFSKELLDPNIVVYLSAKIGDPAVLERFRNTFYTLLKCKQCGLIYQHKILSDRLLSTMYDEWILHREETPRSIEFFAYYANELFTIRALFDKPVHEIKVLDYGLGAGKWAKVAKAIGFDIYGTDLAENLLEDARENGIKTLEIDELPDHQFDFINTEQVFEHLARPKQVLVELLRSLAPGGVIKISVPDGRDIEKRLPLMDWSAPRHSKRFLIPVTPLVHINTFDYDAIRRMGELAGLEVVPTSLMDQYQLLDASSAKELGRSVFRPVRRWLKPRAYAFLRKPR